MRHRATGLRPDLRPGRELVRERVRRVRVLVDVRESRVALREPLRLADRAVGTLERIAVAELRAECSCDALSLERNAIRHHEVEAMTPYRRDERERDAGVAARRVEQ